MLPGVTLTTPGQQGVAFDYPETGATYRDNALGKALTLHEATGLPVVADDSGLEVTALDGAPGVLSARFGDTKARKLTSDERNYLLLARLEGRSDREATFICCLVVVLSARRLYIIQEEMAGEIALAPSGGSGFGYDPVFLVSALGRTVAQLTAAEKDHLSHRGKAARACARLLKV